jgi:hypothetical protein
MGCSKNPFFPRNPKQLRWLAFAASPNAGVTVNGIERVKLDPERLVIKLASNTSA